MYSESHESSAGEDMAYAPIVGGHDFNAALRRVRKVLKIEDDNVRHTHKEHGFWALYDNKYYSNRDRRSVQLGSTEHGGEFGIHFRAKGEGDLDPLNVAGLFVKGEDGKTYITHSGMFDGFGKTRYLKFKKHTPNGWIDVDVEGQRERFLVTEIDGGVSDADILKNVASFVAKVASFKVMTRKPTDPETGGIDAVPARPPHSQAPVLNRIFYGPPGTGKTWEAVSHAVAIMDDKEPEKLAERGERKNVRNSFKKHRKKGRVGFVTFHQNYAYEDFIEGIRPVLRSGDPTGDIAYELHKGIFRKISEHAKENSDDRHVLIIDEINRGNIAKVFGELITLIEPSKRLDNEDCTTVMLPYSGDEFVVPNNLYIVGTMNTADRSIALLDTALRRRFDFIEKMPDVRHVAEDIEGVDGRALLTTINQRIKGYLDREHQIGHTYLIDVETLDDLAEAFQRRIMPLLQEYFYDDWAKIELVLNGNPFICKTDFSSNAGDDFQRTLYDLLPYDDKKWRQADSYQKIYDANVGNHQPSGDSGSAASQ